MQYVVNVMAENDRVDGGDRRDRLHGPFRGAMTRWRPPPFPYFRCHSFVDLLARRRMMLLFIVSIVENCQFVKFQSVLRLAAALLD